MRTVADYHIPGIGKRNFMCYTEWEKYDNKGAVEMSKMKEILLSLLKLSAIVFVATILGKIFTGLERGQESRILYRLSGKLSDAADMEVVL